MFRDFDEAMKACFSQGWLDQCNEIHSLNNLDIEDHTVFKQTKMEKLLYNEKRKQLKDSGDTALNGLEKSGVEKLKSFASISNDTFQSMYNQTPEKKPENQLTSLSKQFNSMIVDKMQQLDDFQVLKQLTAGNDLEAIEGSKQFVQYIHDNLDDLLKDTSGEKKSLDVMDNIEHQANNLKLEIKDLLDQHERLLQKGMNDQADALKTQIVAKVNTLDGKEKQLEGLSKILDKNKLNNNGKIEKIIKKAVESSLNKVEEISEQLAAWGTGESTGKESLEVKQDIINRVKKNKRFKDMAKKIGKYREIASQELKNTIIYGTGEVFDVTVGNDLNMVLSSEYLNLAIPETMPIFFRDYRAGQLKQYRKRDKVTKGCGNKIVCLDESGSIGGGKDFWCKAFGVAMLDIAIANDKNFAGIHFDTRITVDEINRQSYSPDKVFDFASSYLGGGTNFELPLKKAMELAITDEYKGADIVFVTDGECELSDTFLDELKEFKQSNNVKIYGVLLDAGEGSVSDYTLKKFCDKFYKSSELTEDQIAREILKDIV